MRLMIVITSCQDHCNTLLAGLPISIFGLLKTFFTQQLGHFLTYKLNHGLLLFKILQWPHIALKSTWKPHIRVYKVLRHLAPAHCSDLVHRPLPWTPCALVWAPQAPQDPHSPRTFAHAPPLCGSWSGPNPLKRPSLTTLPKVALTSFLPTLSYFDVLIILWNVIV